MKKPSWIRRLFARPVTRAIRKAPQRVRLAVEVLEDRTVPSAFVVNSTGDSGTGTGLTGDLRYCINQAAVTAGASTIAFDSGVFATAKTINLAKGELELSGGKSLTITGPAAGVTINAGATTRVFGVDGNETATLSHLTITGGGGTSDRGGGVLNFGTLTLNNCTVSGNKAKQTSNPGDGGGIANYGPSATLNNCTVSGNTAAGSAGGLFNAAGETMTLTACTISGNSVTGKAGYIPGFGGGLYNIGTVKLTNCTVSGNSAAYGGGLSNSFGASATLTTCTVSGNSASAGGGVCNNPLSNGQNHYGNCTLTNCTVADNSAGSRGGGVANFGGTTTLTNCTVSGNSAANNASGAGVYNQGPEYGKPSGGTVSVRDTIIAGNIANNTIGPGPDDVGGAFKSQGFNLIGAQSPTGSVPALSSGWVSTDLLGTYVTPLDPKLAALGNYGGPTQTMALLPGSPAINAGASGTGIPTTDERGLARVGATDIGAVESQGYTLTASAGGTGQTAYAGVAFANPLGAKLTEKVSNAPLPGVTITFAGPASGAGIAPASQTATTNATGVASVTPTANGFGGSYTVTATANTIAAGPSYSLHNIALVSIAVGPTNPSVANLSEVQFTATGTYTDGSTHAITNSVNWGSDASSVATIGSAGSAFTTNSGGSTVITASLGGITSPNDTLTVSAVDLLVFNTNDSGPGSLRNAINQASALAPGTSANITFDFNMPQTITLTSGRLVLTNEFGSGNVNITGPAAGLTISGGGVSGIFEVVSDVTATLSGLTIANGVAAQGGGLINGGNVTLNNDIFANNRAVGSNGVPGGYVVGASGNIAQFTGGSGRAGQGGALYSGGGSVTISNTTFAENTAQGGAGGAGGNGKPITLPNGTSAKVAVTNGGIGGAGQGGAIWFNGGSVTISNSAFLSNIAQGGAGGAGGAYLITTVAGSPGAGGVGGAGQGGVIWAGSSAAGVALSITNTTFFSGTALAGLGGAGGANTPITAAAGANGSAGAALGGALLLSTGSAVITNATLAYANAASGGEVALFGGALTLNNTILGTNTGGDIVNSGGTLTGASNLIVDSTYAIAGLTGTIHADPKLALPRNNGGPTETMALLAGSPAIDAGSNALVPAGVTTDQRGKPRIVKGISTAPTAVVDIGAFEYPDPPVGTGQFIVTSTLDDGSAGTLRYEIGLANAAGGDATVAFDPTVFATPQIITLTGAPLELSDTSGTETITGPEAGVTISGAGLSRVLQVDSGVTADLSGLTLSGGAASDGAGVFTAGATTLTDVTIADNAAGDKGGGVFTANGGTTTLIEASVTGNSAVNAGGGVYTQTGGATALNSSTTVSYNSCANANGGGLFNAGATSLTDATVTGNSAKNGGGLYTGGSGTTTLNQASFTGNSASYRGGGLYTGRTGSATLTDCTVSGNTAGNSGGGLENAGMTTLNSGTSVQGNTAGNDGGGVGNYGSIDLDDVTISGNSGNGLGGGGLANFFANATLTNCTISGNFENAGAGAGLLSFYSTLEMIDCTVTGNVGFNSGSGLYIRNGSATLINCTVSDNTVRLIGGGLFAGNATTTLTDCTISGNSAGRGAGVYTNGSSGTTTLTDCTVSGNTAAGDGGGLFTGDGGTTTLFDSSVTGNSAWVGAGVFNSDPSTTTLNDVTVSGNAAGNTGSGVYNTGDGTTSLNDSTIGGNSAGSTGAGAVNQGGTIHQDDQTTDSGNTADVSGGDVVLDPTFSNLAPASIVYGTATTTITGHIGAGTNVPLESYVSIMLASMTQTASVDAAGNFSATFDTSSLNVAGSPYAVTLAFAGNAGFNAVTDTSATLTVTKADATIVVAGYSGTYDGAAHGATLASVTGVDAGGAALGTSFTSTTVTGVPGGTVSWTFHGGNNYNDQSGTAVITITKAHLTVTANAASRKYGAANPTFTDTITGFVDGQSAKVVSGTASFSTPTTDQTASAAGSTYTITVTQGTLSAANYDFTIFDSGTLTVTKAVLTVTAIPQTWFIGQAMPMLTFRITGFVNGDSTRAITGAPLLSTTATSSSPMGSYLISLELGTLSAANYSFELVSSALTRDALFHILGR